MDILTIIGVIVALGAILGGNILEGGHTSSLVQLTAFVIVAGGTVGAIMIQVPIATFKRAMLIASWVFVPPEAIAARGHREDCRVEQYRASRGSVGFGNRRRRGA